MNMNSRSLENDEWVYAMEMGQNDGAKWIQSVVVVAPVQLRKKYI